MTVLDRNTLLACLWSLSLQLAGVGLGTKLSLNPGFAGHRESNT